MKRKGQFNDSNITSTQKRHLLWSLQTRYRYQSA